MALGALQLRRQTPGRAHRRAIRRTRCRLQRLDAGGQRLRLRLRVVAERAEPVTEVARQRLCRRQIGEQHAEIGARRRRAVVQRGGGGSDEGRLLAQRRARGGEPFARRLAEFR